MANPELEGLLNRALESESGIRLTFKSPKIAKARYMGFVTAIREARRAGGGCCVWDSLSILRKDTTIEIIRAICDIEDISDESS